MPCMCIINLSHNQKNFKKYGDAYEEACNIYIDIHFTSVVEKSSFVEIEPSLGQVTSRGLQSLSKFELLMSV